jgi:hypothetical protein
VSSRLPHVVIGIAVTPVGNIYDVFPERKAWPLVLREGVEVRCVPWGRGVLSADGHVEPDGAICIFKSAFDAFCPLYMQSMTRGSCLDRMVYFLPTVMLNLMVLSANFAK